MINFLKTNLRYIGNWASKIAGTILSLLTLLLTFVSWDDLGLASKYDRLLVLFLIVIVSIIFAFLILFFKQSNVLWEMGIGKIKVIYGDILKIAFPKKDKGSKIVVIPVNTCFDTIVGYGLVSEKTIHGKWIVELGTRGVNTAELDKQIIQNIKDQGLRYSELYSESQKPKGKRERFAQGTVLSVEGKFGITYYLLALSEFDKNLNAQCSKEEFIACIQSLMAFYDKNGQGRPIYLPLMGTGLSRVNISPEESLNILVNIIKLNRDRVHGEVNIVVFSRQKDTVSIHSV